MKGALYASTCWDGCYKDMALIQWAAGGALERFDSQFAIGILFVLKVMKNKSCLILS